MAVASKRLNLSIHGRDRVTGKLHGSRYNPAPVVSEAVPTNGYTSRRQARKANRKEYTH